MYDEFNPFDHIEEEHIETRRSYSDTVIGIVSDRRLDPTLGPIVRVTYPDCDGKVSPWLQVGQSTTIGRAHYVLPRLRERVVVHKLANGREDGIVTHSLYSAVVSTPTQSSVNNEEATFDDGSVLEMNPDTGNLSASVTNNVQLGAGGTILIAGNGDITINGYTTININAQGAIKITTPSTVTVTAPIINLSASNQINANGVTISPNGSVTIPTSGSLTVQGQTTTVNDINIMGTESGGGGT